MKLPNAILQELRDTSPMIADIQKQNVWRVPAGYFDSILPSILSAIEHSASVNINEVEEELKTISPLLASLSKAPMLSIPKNYFDDGVYNNQHKIIFISNKRKKKYVWMIAASVTLLLGLGLYQWFSSGIHWSGIDEITLAENLDKIDEQSLLAYVHNNPIVETPVYNTAINANWDVDINEAFKQIDASEIKEYVMENEYLIRVKNE